MNTRPPRRRRRSHVWRRSHARLLSVHGAYVGRRRKWRWPHRCLRREGLPLPLLGLHRRRHLRRTRLLGERRLRLNVLRWRAHLRRLRLLRLLLRLQLHLLMLHLLLLLLPPPLRLFR